jgi:predicted dehydrogenase
LRRQLVAAAEKYKRIVQHGTQSRSNNTLIRDIKLIHAGFIGQIVESRGYVYKNGNRGSIGRGKPGPVPAQLDWTLWQGPARESEYMVNTVRQKPGLYVHYDWHYFWEYGNGEIGNQGVHQMDIAYWGHGRGLPVKVYSSGGRYGLNDDGQTPNTQASTFTYADGSIMTFEVRNWGRSRIRRRQLRQQFLWHKGILCGRSRILSYQEKKGAERDHSCAGPAGRTVRVRGNGSSRQSRCANRGPAGVHLDAHISCAHCHLGNAAFRVGHSLEFDPKTERFKDNSVNKYLTREYRKGFEVPKVAGDNVATV